MPHVELDTGINAFYRREGEGPPLVLIMGTGLDHRCWDGQVREYRRSYDCIRFDNRGTGRTDSTGGDVSMRLLADDTASLMDKLGIRRAHVSGLSLGSCVAQELALARPRPRRDSSTPRHVGESAWVRGAQVCGSGGDPEDLRPAGGIRDQRAVVSHTGLHASAPWVSGQPDRGHREGRSVVGRPGSPLQCQPAARRAGPPTPDRGADAGDGGARSTLPFRPCTPGRWRTRYPARSWCCSREAATFTTWRTRRSSTP